MDDFHLCISDRPIDEKDYELWFEEIPLYTPAAPKPKEQNYVTQVHVFEPPAPIPPSTEILSRLRNFRIEQSTPMECMLFLSRLQKELP